jgi:predicted DNA-binding protein
MAGLTKRVNLSLEVDIVKDLEMLAKAGNKSVSTIAKELILKALDLNEDIYLANLAEQLESENPEAISHEEFWDSIEKNV